MNPVNVDSLQSRIRERRENLRLSRPMLAARLNIARSTVQNWEEGRIVPRGGKLQRLATALGVSVEWLQTGKGPIEPLPPFFVNPSAPPAETPKQVEAIKLDQVMVPFREGKAGAADYLTFPRWWIQRMLPRHGSPSDLTLLEVQGDSMAPTLADGDLVILYHGATEGSPEGLWVYRIGADLHIKRLQRRGDALAILSDNPAYPVTVLDSTNPQHELIGRVLWAIKRF